MCEKRFSKVSGLILPNAIVISLCMSAFIATATASNASDSVDLLVAMKLAEDNSPALQRLRHQIRIRELEERNSFWTFFPSLDFSATHGLGEENPTLISSPYRSKFAFSLTETLYDNGKSIYGRDAAKISLNLAQAEYALERDKLTMSLGLAFLKFSQSLAAQRVQQSQYELINKQFLTIDRQYRQGVKAKKEHIKFKTELLRAQLELRNSTSELARTRIDLLAILGKPDSEGYEPIKLSPIHFDPVSAFELPKQRVDVSRHQLVKIGEFRQQLQSTETQLARSLYGPEVKVSAGTSWGGNQYLGTGNAFPGNRASDWNAMVTLNWNLWSWGTRKRNVQIAEEKQGQIRVDQQKEYISLHAEAEKIDFDLRQSFDNQKLSLELLELELQNYRLLERGYYDGRVSANDLVLALRDLLSAKTKSLSSIHDLRANHIKFDYYEGKLYEELKIHQ